jgi:CHAT domain-containing protein
LDAFAASSQGLADASEKWEKAMESLFTQQLVGELRRSDIIYLGLDGVLQRIPVGVIRKYLESRGMGSSRLIIVNDLADVGMSRRSNEGGMSTIFYAPNYGESAGCNNSGPCAQRWSALPYSLKEGQAISSLFNARSLTGDQATKSSLVSAQNPKLLHISTHAGFLPTRLDAHGQSSTNEHDGLDVLDGLYELYIAASGANVLPPALSILTYKELAGLNLSGTSLVVISACETGLGSSARGYGLFGMHRILASVGAESTLLSMWKVDDEATSVFMKLFYSEVAKGRSLDISLARAQDRMLTDPEFKARGWSHPYYWAGWQIAGNMSPVTIPAR